MSGSLKGGCQQRSTITGFGCRRLIRWVTLENRAVDGSYVSHLAEDQVARTGGGFAWL